MAETEPVSKTPWFKKAQNDSPSYSVICTGISKSRVHHTKQLYFAGLMHKLQDIWNLLLMIITLHLRNAKSNHVFTTYARNGFPVQQCKRELFLPCLSHFVEHL
jgi:hypothetical protein